MTILLMSLLSLCGFLSGIIFSFVYLLCSESIAIGMGTKIREKEVKEILKNLKLDTKI